MGKLRAGFLRMKSAGRAGRLLLLMILVIIVAVVVVILVLPRSAKALNYYVAPSGNNAASGKSPRTPFRTVQHALDVARPGAIIHLAPGDYYENLTTRIAGKANQPISIVGTDAARNPANQEATVVYGSQHVVAINHSYYHLEGFAIEGQAGLKAYPYPTDPSQMNAYKDAHQSVIKDGRLIYVASADTASHLTGIVINNMFLQGAGGECVRLRNDSHDNRVTNSVIRYCGLFGKTSNQDRYKYHNGEGVYIGTSPKSNNQPAAQNDTSNHNTVSHNTIDTYGSECVDIKESAHDNLVSNNVCRYNLEPTAYDGSNLEVRGDHNRILNNTISQSTGWNLKLVSDSKKYDRGGNVVEQNRLSQAASGINIYVKQAASGLRFCGNSLDGNTQGISKATATTLCHNGT